MTFRRGDGDVKAEFGIGAGSVILGAKMVVGFEGKVERSAIGEVWEDVGWLDAVVGSRREDASSFE